MIDVSSDTRKRLAYAAGYLELRLVAEARAELAGVAEPDRGKPGVVAMSLEAAMAAQAWDEAVGLAERMRAEVPTLDAGWLHGAFATRRAGGGGAAQLVKARAILEAAEARLGARSPLLHYNLACYLAQMGELDGARERLARAVAMEPAYAELAKTDEDLEPLRRAG